MRHWHTDESYRDPMARSHSHEGGGKAHVHNTYRLFGYGRTSRSIKDRPARQPTRGFAYFPNQVLRGDPRYGKVVGSWPNPHQEMPPDIERLTSLAHKLRTQPGMVTDAELVAWERARIRRVFAASQATKKINGRIWRYMGTFTSKKGASFDAGLARGIGFYARLINIGNGGYEVYLRRRG